MSPDPPYPGARWGLPAHGRGSIATFPRRLVAIILDWTLSQLIAYAVFGVAWGATGAESFVPLAVFAVENLLLVSTLGATIGHRALGLQVHRLHTHGANPLGAAPGPVGGLVRTVLLCLAVPALIPDRDNRGLHDKAAGTVIVRSR